jgi:hypothetical protein
VLFRSAAWFWFSPSYGFRRCLVVVATSPSRRLPLMGSGCATECCKRRRIERIGLLDPAPASSFPISPSRFSNRLRLPNTFVSGSSSRALCLPSRVHEPSPARHSCPDTFPGLPSLIATSESGVHIRELPKLASFRPRRFSRPRRLPPPPTFAGLFHPAATSRVRSSGSFPREKPHELVARRCPHAVARRSCQKFNPMAPERRARLQGLAPLANPSQHTAV